MSFGSSAQKGCYCALSTAASHGQRKVFGFFYFKKNYSGFSYRKALHKLVTHPTTLTSQNSGREVSVLIIVLVLTFGIGISVSFDKAGASVDIVILGVELRGDPCGGCAGPGEL